MLPAAPDFKYRRPSLWLDYLALKLGASCDPAKS
jgi:hypothetical protein